MELDLVTPVNEIGNPESMFGDQEMLFVAKNDEDRFIFSYLPIGKPMSLFMAPCDSEDKLLGFGHKMVDCADLQDGLQKLGVTVKGLP